MTKLPMGKTINTHFGFIELPSSILQVSIFEDFMHIECEDGIYEISREYNPEVDVTIKKVFSKS